MNVLMWIMSNGERRDMIATCPTGDGKWLTLRWDFRPDAGLVGYARVNATMADDDLLDWTDNLEADGSSIVVGPREISLPGPELLSDERTILGWWRRELQPVAMSVSDEVPADGWECTLGLPV